MMSFFQFFFFFFFISSVHMSKEEELITVEDFDKAANPVGKPKRCSCHRYREHILKKARAGGSALGGTWTEFKLFITKGNIFQMAIGFILALQFNNVVQSLTNDIVMPPIGMAIGNNLISLFVVIKFGKSYFNQSNIVNGNRKKDYDLMKLMN